MLDSVDPGYRGGLDPGVTRHDGPSQGPRSHHPGKSRAARHNVVCYLLFQTRTWLLLAMVAPAMDPGVTALAGLVLLQVIQLCLNSCPSQVGKATKGRCPKKNELASYSKMDKNPLFWPNTNPRKSKKKKLENRNIKNTL